MQEKPLSMLVRVNLKIAQAIELYLGERHIFDRKFTQLLSVCGSDSTFYSVQSINRILLHRLPHLAYHIPQSIYPESLYPLGTVGHKYCIWGL